MTTKKAASQSKMNQLHDAVADVFLRVLSRYNEQLDTLDNLKQSDLDEMSDTFKEDVLSELFREGAMPSPAMLSAMTKFLKDNEVTFEKEKLEEISAQQRALEEKRRHRPNLDNLLLFPAAAEG